MSGRSPRYLDYGPLDELVARVHGANAPVTVIARQLGVDRQQVHRWRKSGRLTLFAADLAAAALGRHPLNIWPDFHDGIDLDAD